MALDNLSEQRIQETYQKLVQTENGEFADGLGNSIDLVIASETASFAFKTEISGAFSGPSASISARLNTLEAAETHLHEGALSSSYQIESEISGAFTEASHSLQTRVATLEATEEHLHDGTISSSIQIESEISGAFTEASHSLQLRLTTAESELGNTLISGSYQIESEISGAFNEVSHSLQSRIVTMVTNTTTNSSNILDNTNNITSLTTATSSYLLNTTDTLTGNLTITGKLIAEQYIVSSSVTLMTQSFSSGSTIFGDDTSDTHQFTGSVFISGSSLQINGADVLTASPFTPAGISGSFNGQTGSFVTNSQTSSFVTNSDTASFLVSSDTASFLVSSDTASFLVSSDIASFVTNSQTSSFLVSSDTASFLVSSDTASFVTNSQTSSFLVSSDTASFAITGSNISFSNITASGNISASGHLFISASTTASALNTLMYDTATGQIYYTGSYGGGGGSTISTGAGFPFEGNAVITGSLIVSGTVDQDIKIFNDILPGISDEYTLGTSANKWNAVFATNTFFGGIHEINLETIGISQLQTGTVLVSKAGQMVPCDTKGDALVMGVVTSGSDYPIIMGAEPVLVDGPVYEGDYIITSDRLGYGTAVPPDKIYEQRLFGKIIAQSLETNLTGGSIKAMIRKM